MAITVANNRAPSKAVYGECTPCSIAIHLYSLWPGHPYEPATYICPVHTCHRAYAYMPNDDTVWHCHLHACHLCPLAWPIHLHLPHDELKSAIGGSPEPTCPLALTPLFGWRRSWVGGTKTFDKRQSILVDLFLHLLDIPGFSLLDSAF